MARKEIAQKIVIDEDELFERLVDLAGSIFKLDRRGEIVWIVPKDGLTDREKVAVVLVAQHLAMEAGIAEDPTISNSSISEKLGMPSMSVNARLAELRELGVAHQERVGVHRVVLHGAERMIEEVAQKVRFE